MGKEFTLQLNTEQQREVDLSTASEVEALVFNYCLSVSAPVPDGGVTVESSSNSWPPTLPFIKCQGTVSAELLGFFKVQSMLFSTSLRLGLKSFAHSSVLYLVSILDFAHGFVI